MRLVAALALVVVVLAVAVPWALGACTATPMQRCCKGATPCRCDQGGHRGAAPNPATPPSRASHDATALLAEAATLRGAASEGLSLAAAVPTSPAYATAAVYLAVCTFRC